MIAEGYNVSRCHCRPDAGHLDFNGHSSGDWFATSSVSGLP